MRTIFAVLFLATVSLASVSHLMDLNREYLNSDPQTVNQFQAFQKKHQKVYNSPEEHLLRFRVFKKNLNRIKFMTINDPTAVYGVTQFADLTEAEFAKRYLSSFKKAETQPSGTFTPKMNAPLPTSFDWREKNVVSSVKNQGGCGSCWAFSAIGNVESQYAIKYGNVIDFSEQQLVDCDRQVDEGCNGGFMGNAFDYIREAGGIESANDYKYEGRDGPCRFNRNKTVAQVTGYLNISQNEDVIAAALVEYGPLAIALDATWLQFYFGGISNPWFCSKNLNHGVLMVGYGVSGNTPYWIVKNSWGAGWGEKGYFRMIRGVGKCGINEYVVTAQVA